MENAHVRATENHHAEIPRETMEEKASRIVSEELDKLGWTAAELASPPKGDARKIWMAQRLRRETAVTLKWIAAQLHIGTWTHMANRLQNAKNGKQTIQINLDWCKYSGLTPLNTLSLSV